MSLPREHNTRRAGRSRAEAVHSKLTLKKLHNNELALIRACLHLLDFLLLIDVNEKISDNCSKS